MGFAAQGQRMKINEQLPTATTNKAMGLTTNHPNNFERFILSPTGDNSGDAYYWQHQNHLQKSSLSFVAKPVQDKPYKHEEVTQINLPLEREEPTNAVCIMPIQLNHHESEPLHDTDCDMSEEPIKPRHTVEMLVQEASAFIQTNSALESHALLPKHTVNNGQRALSALPILKKHHLFIEEDNAELSINLDGLNKKEQHELTHLISKYLQQKNLKLTQLIINGVNYD